MDQSELRAARTIGYENPRPDVRAHVPDSARRILDLGCASGLLGQAVAQEQAGRHVVGVEFDPTYAKEAEQRLDRVLVMDLDQLPGQIGLLAGDGPFDCILAADVLEHLRDPWGVLSSAVSLLAPDGVVVVSLPNVRHWTVLRALLLRGIWPREPRGIFDATHLRWFTRHDARALLEGAGLETISVSRQYWERRPLRGIVRRLDGTALAAGPISEFFAYQHVLVGHPRA